MLPKIGTIVTRFDGADQEPYRVVEVNGALQVGLCKIAYLPCEDGTELQVLPAEGSTPDLWIAPNARGEYQTVNGNPMDRYRVGINERTVSPWG